MAKISKTQVKQIQATLDESFLLSIVNKHLAESGLSDFCVQSIKLVPIERVAFDSHDNPPRCVHGFPQLEVCTPAGICRWECNHP